MATGAGSRKQGAFGRRTPLARLIAAKRWIARLVLFLERLVPPLAALLSVVALYLAASWFGLFRAVPDIARLGLLVVFAVALVAALLPFRRLRFPGEAEADRIVVDVEGGGGILVLTRAWLPIYRARLADGAPLATQPVDVALLGVEVPPGKRRVKIDVSSSPEIVSGALAIVVAAGLATVVLRRAA